MNTPKSKPHSLKTVLVLLAATIITGLLISVFSFYSFPPMVSNLIGCIAFIVGYYTVYLYLFAAYAFWGSFRFVKEMIDLYEWKGNEKVLYIGPTNGRVVIAIAKKLTTGTCTAIDFFNAANKEEVFTLIKADAQCEGVLDRITLQEEYMPNTGFADESFDVIFSNMGLIKKNRAAELERTTAELKRVLKNNGKAIVADTRKPGKLVTACSQARLFVQRAGNYLLIACIPLKVLVITKGYEPRPLEQSPLLRRRKKISKIILWITILALLGYAFISLKRLSEGAFGFQLGVSISHELTAEDSSLIGQKYLDKITVIEIDHNKVRGPISLLQYGNKFDLMIYKIGPAPVGPLSQVFNIDTKDESITGSWYGVVRSGEFEVKFKDLDTAKKIDGPVTNVYVAVAGDSGLPAVTVNDSIANYTALCKNFYIKYYPDGPVDIYAESQAESMWSSGLILTDVLFIKRNGALYFLLLSADDKNTRVPGDLLYNIVMNK